MSLNLESQDVGTSNSNGGHCNYGPFFVNLGWIGFAIQLGFLDLMFPGQLQGFNEIAFDIQRKK